jgi:hypothetical protein
LLTNISANYSEEIVSVYIASNTNCVNNNLTKDELIRYSKKAVAFWNSVPTSSLRLEVKGEFQTTDPLYRTGVLCADDGSNPCNPATSVPRNKNIIITCNNETGSNFPSGQVLGKSTIVWLSNTNIQGSAVLLNDDVATTIDASDSRGIIALLAHEIGHAIGIGHSQDSAALMYEYNISKRYALAQDDIDAVTYLYPKRISGDCDGFLLTTDEKKGGNGPMSMLFALSTCFFAYNFFRKRRF